jgi:flavin-dependent dehydrogenase
MKKLVVIAGGGPAGMATAIVLANRGIDCMIAEHAAQLLPKAGETIPPNARLLFAKLGIESMLTAPEHLPCHGNRFVWGRAGEKSFFSALSAHGWHLNRMYFEAQLRQHTQSLKVQWLADWRVINCKRSNEDWEITLHDDAENEQQLHCNFLVDATGRACRIARMFGYQRTRLDALTGLWCVVDTIEQVKPYYTFIEATPAGWWYAAPLQDKKLSLAFMTDSDLLDAGMQSMESFLQAAGSNALIKPLLEKIIFSEQVQPAVNPASTSYVNTRYSDGWLAVGDAAYAYDPISSYGMVSALESGYHAGHSIAEYIAGNADALPAYDYLGATTFNTYLRMHAHQYQQEHRWPNETFWKRRPLTFTP